MFGIRARSPVAPDEEAWLEDTFYWLRTEFGDAALREPVLLPTAADFPVPDPFTEDGVREVLAIVAVRMGVRPEDVDLDYLPDEDAELPYVWQRSGAAGHFLLVDGRPRIAVLGDREAGAQQLVATVAHELAHVRLLAEGRLTVDRRDHEAVTDLLTVALGLGVFTANAAYDFAAHQTGWSSRRLGYLTEQMFGYALAMHATARGEPEPAWARHLDHNPRGYLRAALRYRERSARGRG